MTIFAYEVVNRPKKDAAGRTNVGWNAECGREAVQMGGYLITNRASKGTTRQYTAVALVPNSEGVTVEETLAETFTTRAQAAFAIWRRFYADLRLKKAAAKAEAEAEKQARRDQRAATRAYRETDEGKAEYRAMLNAKARARRAAMTDEEKAAEAAKRRVKREQKLATEALSTAI